MKNLALLIVSLVAIFFVKTQVIDKRFRSDVILKTRIQVALWEYDPWHSYKVIALYDNKLEPLGVTSKIGNTFIIRVREGADTEELIHHEAAHVITWDEIATHGTEWLRVMKEMGFEKESKNYVKMESQKYFEMYVKGQMRNNR